MGIPSGMAVAKGPGNPLRDGGRLADAIALRSLSFAAHRGDGRRLSDPDLELLRLREIAGNAALQVDPNDVDAITADLEKLLDDDSLRARLVDAGRARSEIFSWTRCAEETLDVLQHIAGHGSEPDRIVGAWRSA